MLSTPFSLKIGFFVNHYSVFSVLLMNRLLPSSTLEILIPANAVGKVIGKSGANIANIRQVCS